MRVQPLQTARLEVVPPQVEGDQRVAVLLNPNARKVTKKVVRALSHVVPEGDLYLSRSELDARRIAQAVVDAGYRTIFLGGGDGTVACFLNEILNQVALRRRHHPTPTPRFGVLKLGTGNSVASLVKASGVRDDGIVDDVLRARAGEVPGFRAVDLLLIDGRRAPFAGMGLDGRLLNDYVWVKDSLGQGPLARVMSGPGGYFTSVAFKTVPYYLTHATDVECEVINGRGAAFRVGPDGRPVGDAIAPGEVLYSGPLKLAAAGTVPFYGYELKMFPFAGRRRGMMNLRLATVPTTSILANLPSLWKGTWFPDGIKDYYAREVTIRFSADMPLQVAGDAAGYRREVHLEVAPEPIELADFSAAN